jgi:PKD repeat protein
MERWMRSSGLLRLVVGFLAVLLVVSLSSTNALGQNPPCTLTVTPASGFAPLNVTATASCDPQSGLTPTAVDWGDQTPQTPLQNGSASHSYTSTGTFFVQSLDANGGFLAGANVTVQTPVACKLAMNPSRGAAPLNSTATGICSSVNSTITSVAIDFGDGNSTPLTNGSSITASNTYTQPSQYFATITGKDSNGQTGSRSQFVNVTATPPSLPVAPTTGDVYVSGDTSTVEHHNNKGTLLDALQVVQSSNTLGGMAFDSNRTLFVADRSGGDDTSFANAYYFDASGTAQVLTSQLSLTNTGTLVFDNAGNVYLGGDGPVIQKLDSFARVLFNYAPASGGPNNPTFVKWMDLATDQCTMFYTDSANPSSVRRFDVCKNSQLADFTTSLPGTSANDLRIRPNGEVLVADTDQVVRMDATGKPIQTYGGPRGTFTGLALDPDNTSFWVTQGDGSVTRFDIASGSVLSKFNANLAPAEGVTVFGEIRAATNTPPSCTVTASPTTGTAPLNVTVTGSCTPGVNPITSTVLDFGDGTTQTATSGTHTYKAAGTFTIKLTATNSFGLSSSASQNVTVSAPPPPPPVTPPGIIPTGLFVSFGGGTIKQVSTTDGSVIRTLSTGLGGTIAGMAFDRFGTLYAMDFTAGNVSKFDILGTPLGTFGSGYDCQPESIVFDGAGNVYVGQQGCSRTVLKFSPNGQLLAQFRVTVENQGADQIELSADQCTLFYTSEGPSILRYNVCTGQQLPVFANNLSRALTLRILPDGGVLVTDEKEIIRLDGSGQKITTYTAAGEQCWDGLTLDPDRTSFWAADFCTSNIYKFDIATGRQLGKFNPGAPSGSIFSIAMGGTGLNVGGVGFAGALTASPQAASLSNGQSATFTISFNALQNAIGQAFQLSCANLPASLKCSFSPQSITPGVAGPAGTSTLTISAVTTTAAIFPAQQWMLAASLGIVPGMVLMTLPVARRRRTRVLVLLGLIAAMLLASSCGGGNKPKPAGTASKGSFTVLVIGNAGQLQASTPINVTVQ